MVVAEGLEVAISNATGGTGYAFDANVSVNLMDVSSGTSVSGLTLTGDNEHAWKQLAWAGDAQVTGGTAIGVSKGNSAYAAGASLAYAEINNTVTSEVKDSDLGTLSSFSLEALSSMTQVTTSVSGQVAVASEAERGSLAVTGAAAAIEITNDVRANAEGVTADLAKNGTFDVVAESVRRKDAKNDAQGDTQDDDLIQTGNHRSYFTDEQIQTQEDFRKAVADIRNDPGGEGADEDIASMRGINKTVSDSAQNDAYIKDVELKSDTSLEAATDYSVEDGNQNINDLRTPGQFEQLSVVATLASGTETVGGAVLVEDIDNTFKATASGLTLNGSTDAVGTALRIRAESQATSIGASAGATVSLEEGWLNMGGSVVVSNVNQTSEAGLSDSFANVPDVQINAQNHAITANLAGNVGVSISESSLATAGAAIVVQNTENTAKAYASGKRGNEQLLGQPDPSLDKGFLEVTAVNKAQSWAAAVEAEVSAKTAMGGSVAVNRVFQHTDATLSDAYLSSFYGVDVLSSDDSNAWTLAGGVSVTWSSGVAGNGAVAYTQSGRENDEQEGDTLYKKTGTRANVKNVDLRGSVISDMTVKAENNDALHTLAVTAGFSVGSVGFAGSANVNSIYHATGVEIDEFRKKGGVTINRNFEAQAKNNASISGLSITAAGAVGAASVGLATAVNRMDSDTYVSVSGSTISSQTSHVEARSNLDTDIVGVTGGGAADAAGDGFVAVNLISDNTKLSVGSTNISTGGANVLEAIGTSTIGSYAGNASGSGEAAGGVSVSVSERTGDVTADIADSNLTSRGNGYSLKRTTGIDDDDIIKENYEQDIDVADSLADEFRTADTNGVAVGAYSASTFKAFSVLGAGSGDAALGGLGLGAVESGNTDLKISNSEIEAGTADTDVKAGGYTNSYSVLVQGDGSGAFAADVNGEWITSERDVSATVSKSTLSGNDVTLAAENKFGSSGVTVPVAGSGSLAAGASGVMTRNTGSATARLSDSLVSASHDYEQNAYRLSNMSFLTAGAHGAGILAVTGDIFISYDHGDATSYVDGSSVKAGNDITVKSDRSTNIESVAAAIDGAGGAAANGIVSVNTINARSLTDVTGKKTGEEKTFDAGGNVKLSAEGESKTSFVEVDVSVAIEEVSAAVGFGITETSDNTSSSVSVASADMNAGKDVEISASLDRFHDQETVFVAVSGGTVSASGNLAVSGLDINTAYDAGSDPNAGTKIDGYRQRMSTTGTNFLDDPVFDSDGGVTGSVLTEDEKAGILDATSGDASVRVIGKTSADITGSTVTGQNISVRTAEDTADKAGANLESADAELAVSIGLTLAVNLQTINQSRNMVLNVDGSKLTAENDLKLLNEAAGTYRLREWSVDIGILEAGFKQAKNSVSGMSSISVMNGSVLQGNTVSLENTDSSFHRADSRSLVLSGAVAQPTSVRVTDESGQRLGIDQSEIDAKAVSLSVDRNHRLESYMEPIVMSDYAVFANETVSLDDSGSGDWMTLTGSVFNAELFQANANYRSDIHSSSDRYYLTYVSGVDHTALAQAKGDVGISSTGNTFNTDTLVIASSAGLYTKEDAGDSKSLRLSAGQVGDGVGVALSVGKQPATAQSDVQVGNTFADNEVAAKTDDKLPSVALVSLADIEFNASGEGGTGGLIPTTIYEAEAVNNTKTSLNAEGLSSGGTTKTAELFAGAVNNSVYTVETQTIDIGVVEVNDTSKTSVTDKSSAVANISGNWSSETDMMLFSALSSVGKLYASAEGGSVAGYSGATVKVDVQGDAALTVKSAGLSAADIGLFAVTDTTLGSSNSDPALKTVLYGGVIAGSGELTNNVTRNATVTVEDSTVTAGKSLAVGATNLSDIKFDVSGVAGGLADGAYATTYQTLSFTNTVDVLGDTDIMMTDRDSKLVIAAWSEDDVEVKASAKAEGLLIWGDGTTSLELQRTNLVHVGDGAKIYSAGEIDLNAGTGIHGHESSKYVVASELIMDGIETDVDSNLIGTAKLKDHVVIDAGGDIKAVTDVNIYAGDGNFELLQESRKIYEDVSETTQDKVPVAVQKESDGHVVIDSDSLITVDGLVTAGMQNKSVLTFEGFVVPPGDLPYTLTDGDGNRIVPDSPGYQLEGVAPEVLKMGTESVANHYWERHLELQQLISDYQAQPQTDETRAMVLAYMQEDQFLLNEMVRRGLAEQQPDGSYVVVDSIYRTLATVSGITVSGGDISLRAAAVSGSGTLNAQGGEGITINNLSSMALDVSDFTVVKDGGKLTVNGDDFTSSGNAAVVSGFTGKTLESGGTADTNNINISSDYSGNHTVIATQEGVSKQVVVDNSVTVSGVIDNRAHDITIDTQGDTTVEETGALHAAGSIQMSAKGDVVQQYAPGLTNIGGDANAPETMYQDSVKSFMDTAGKDDTKDGYSYATNTAVSGYEYDYLSGIVAGGDIYIAGEMINVNGLIQSGFSEYVVDVTDAASEQRIRDITDAWQAMGSPDITSLKTDTYLVKKGGNYLREDGSFGYRPDVWYNPSTKTLELPEIKATGGNIYLTGQISSTGNSYLDGAPSSAGRIYAADGPVSVDIKAGAHDLSLSTVDTGADRVGFIRITDTGYMSDEWDAKVTEYTGGTKTSYMTKVADGKTVDGDRQNDSDVSHYQPKEGLVYGWTTGESVGTTTVKTTESDDIFWAWTIDEDTVWVTDTVRTGESALSSGGTVRSVTRPDEDTKDNEFVAWVSKQVDSETSTTETWKTCGFMCFSSTYYTKVTTVTQSTDVYSMTAKADKPITVGMLKGDGTVNVSTGGSLLISGNVTAKDGDVTLSAQQDIRAKNDTASIRDAKSLTMTATEGSVGSSVRPVKVSGAYEASSDKAWAETAAPEADIAAMTPDAKSEYDALASSKILTLNATAGQGVYIDGSGWNNRIEAGEITAGTDAILSAVGDVKAGTVNARNMTVSSDKGSVYIGHVEQKEAVDFSQQLNGSARYRYTVDSATGDFSLGQITLSSENSVVTLHADGSIKNGLPREEPGDFTAEDKLAMWEKMGLLGENGAYIGDSIRSEREGMLKDSTTAGYNLYLEFEADPNKSQWNEQKWLAYRRLKDSYGQYETLDDAIKGVTDQHLGDDTKLGWTKNELLFALAESVAHPDSSSSEALFMSVPNVTARTVNLTSDGGQVGTQEAPAVWSYGNIRDSQNNGAFYEAAYLADAGDVVWDKEAKTVTVTVHRPITMASPDADIQSHLSAQTNSDADKAALTVAYLSENPLIVDKATTEGSLRISTRQGVETGDDTVVMTGDTVTLHAGEGSIDHVKLDAKTWALLTAGGDISVESAAEKLALYAVSGGGDVTIKAGEIGSYVDPENPHGAASSGVVDAAGTVYLDAENIGIGNDTKEALRLADGSVVEIDSPLNSVYMTSLGSVQVGTEGGTSSELTVGKDAEKDGTGVFSLVSKNAELMSGIKAEEMLLVTATDGSVTSDGKLTSGGDIVMNATDTITLKDDVNADGDVNVKTGDLLFEPQAADPVKVSGNNVTIEQMAGTATPGKADISADNELTLLGRLIAAGDWKLSSGGDMRIGNVDTTDPDASVTKSVIMEGTSLSAGGNLSFEATDYVAVTGGEPVLSGGDMDFYSNGTVLLGADLKATGDLSVKTENDDGTKDRIEVVGGLESVNGSVMLESDTVDMVKEPGTVRRLTAKKDVTVKSGSSVGLGNAQVTAKEGDILVDAGGISALGADMTAEQGSIRLVAAPKPGEGVFAPHGHVEMSGANLTAKNELSASAESVLMNNVSADADDIGLSADRGIALTGRTAMRASEVTLSSAHANVSQEAVAPGAGIEADRLTASAAEGSVSLGALPVDGIGGNRVADMDITVRKSLNIGASADALNLGVTQTADKIGDMTVYNASGTVSLANDLSAANDVLVYAAGINAKNLASDGLLELSTIGLEDTVSGSGAGTGVKAGDLRGNRVAVAALTGDIGLGDVRSSGRTDIYRNSAYSAGDVSVGNVTAGTSLKLLNARGNIRSGHLSAADRQESAVMYDPMSGLPALNSMGSGILRIPVSAVTRDRSLQTAMSGLTLPNAALIKGAHVDLISFSSLMMGPARLLAQASVYRSYDLNSPAGYYFGLNIREDISADSVDGLPILHDNMITGEKDFPVMPDIVLAPEADGDIRLDN